MDTKFARKLIERPDSATKQLFEGPHPGILWVDWREANDDIVHMVAEAIGEPMPTAWQGSQLLFEYRGQRIEVPLSGAAGEQDLTLAALNHALSRSHEIRHVAASAGGDTIAFIILTKRQWSGLVGKYGEDAVDTAFPGLDPKKPLFGGGEASRETIAAQIEAANPGMLGSLKLGRAAIRLLNAEQADELRRRHADEPDAMPVMRPYCGDLVLSYFKDLLHSSNAISEGELRSFHLSDEQLHALAEQHCDDAWYRFRIQKTHGVGRMHAGERIDNSSIACCYLWNVMGSDDAPVVAAFPSRDVVLFTTEGDADGIGFLIASIDAAGRDPASALSRELFVRVEGRWQVRPYREAERRAAPDSLLRAAETGDYATQCEWANMMQRCGMADQAAAIYLRAGPQAEAARVDSPDMFVNGSALLCNLADLYEHGLGVAQDFAEAQAWYRRSAAMNNFVAEYSLGNLYLNGLGVPRDVEQARYWFERSAQQGYADARKALDMLAT